MHTVREEAVSLKSGVDFNVLVAESDTDVGQASVDHLIKFRSNLVPVLLIQRTELEAGSGKRHFGHVPKIELPVEPVIQVVQLVNQMVEQRPVCHIVQGQVDQENCSIFFSAHK